MSAENELAVFPITGWKLGRLPGHEALLMQFSFVKSTLHPVEDSLETNLFCLSPEMTRDLIKQLSESLNLINTMHENSTLNAKK